MFTAQSEIKYLATKEQITNCCTNIHPYIGQNFGRRCLELNTAIRAAKRCLLSAPLNWHLRNVVVISLRQMPPKLFSKFISPNFGFLQSVIIGEKVFPISARKVSKQCRSPDWATSKKCFLRISNLRQIFVFRLKQALVSYPSICIFDIILKELDSGDELDVLCNWLYYIFFSLQYHF